MLVRRFLRLASAFEDTAESVSILRAISTCLGGDFALGVRGTPSI
jgi:hypothetical protein